MPLVDIPADPEYSRLIIAPGTHTLGGYSCSTGRDTSNSASNLLPSGWSDGGKQSICGQSTWHVPSQLSAGDIILFNIKTVHAANRHNRDDFRISIDTRIVGHESRKQHM
jgi:ectoine hydroxylase-related dioxygenase (phytanoyl-CoA dioxygenase family)